MIAAVASASLLGCGGTDHARPMSATSGVAQADARNASVRLVLADVNATALPRAYEPQVLRNRMERYVANGWVERRTRLVSDAIANVGGRAYTQPWTEAITVGQWKSTRLKSGRADVKFIAMETLSQRGRLVSLPLEQYTVRMAHERGRWMLVTYDKRWLRPEGPMAPSGRRDLARLPEHVVFKNPRL
ncbi:hypothetical protein Q5424_04760 [Conexibacter sp. JD483]|uniref:hypothetical protein n=1 Tax=unclassified Conexibacter TaxID=2627773 RepID=UPI00271F5AB0|nr:MULTISPECIES: hypothetical protein [unclassified Conexibacter]MDO8184643.1 hypothetical protein [Conexibacter sp. CPCC 205706]MDO8197949.1 hypothetical protein [Conexibacter sp. CPCC 205762]MDR9368379.1 hypothetical protein [Conexibacter sp. JD483]